ncbi:MAG: nickel pincer cofactor biosynthesis protein LarC [Lachnospiraceae bacterium]|nr:nickel pincer cofactor biosynthesis protein LarC [Lachnospiraceae bacterium]
MLYLECYSGISGDMTVAALLDLGASKEKLLEGLSSLGLDGYEVKIGRRVKCGVEACCFDVELSGSEDGGSHDYVEHGHGHGDHDGHHDHIHEHGHDGSHGHTHEHDHDGSHGHTHEHSHGDHHSHDHSHVHRNLADITEIIRASNLTERAKETALRIFKIVAEAEAKVHGKEISEVHFHEVGAVDSIVDIAAVAICLDDLDITEAVISDICEGSGHVHCQHGILPVPVPAVTAVAQAHGLYLRMTDTKGEMVTPTGAAIAAGIRTREWLPESFCIVKTGMGAGKKDFPKANILRAYLIEERRDTEEKGLWMMETNIDDATGEALGYVMERLFKAGARDVCYLPAFMKKNRPAWLMKVVCDEVNREELEDIIFRHTTTIGIRRYPLERTALPRKICTVETPYGPARVKEVMRGEAAFYYPEYEDVARYADMAGKSFQDIYEEVKRLAEVL